MSVIRIEPAAGQLERVNKLLAGFPGGAFKAVYAALKRAGDTAKTKAGQFAAAQYTISKGTFMSNVNTKSSVSGDMGGAAELRISYAGSVLPLLAFHTRASRNGLVQTQVMRSGGAVTLQHAFIAPVFGQTAVFERVGAPRFPVRQLFGPSTGHMMQNEQVAEQMSETIQDTFDKRVEHELLRVLNGWGGR